MAESVSWRLAEPRSLHRSKRRGPQARSPEEHPARAKSSLMFRPAACSYSLFRFDKAQYGKSWHDWPTRPVPSLSRIVDRGSVSTSSLTTSLFVEVDA